MDQEQDCLKAQCWVLDGSRLGQHDQSQKAAASVHIGCNYIKNISEEVWHFTSIANNVVSCCLALK